MNQLDSATRWTLTLWFLFGLMPLLSQTLPWIAWFNDSRLPSWVQALGSILALLVSALLFILQRRSEQEQLEAERLASHLTRIEGARRLVVAIVNICRKIRHLVLHSSSPTESDLLVMSSELREVAHALRSIQAASMMHWEQTEAVVAATAAAQSLALLVESRGSQLSPDGDAEIRIMLIERVVEIQASLQTRADALESHLDRM